MYKIMSSFLKPYRDADYLVRARAQILFVTLLLLVVIVLLVQFSMLFAGWSDFVKTLYITPGLAVSFLVSLYFLKKGKYDIAAGILVIASATAVVGGMLREPFMFPHLAYTAYVYFIFPVMVMCIIFSTIRLMTVVTGLFIAADIITYYIHHYGIKIIGAIAIALSIIFW